MSEYLSKKAVLEWLDDRRYKSPWIESFRERLESGAFDADNSEIQRLRVAITAMRQAVWDELVPIKLATEINKIADEALSTTTEPERSEHA